MFTILPIAAFLLVDLLLLSVCTDLSWRRVLIWTVILSCEDEHPVFIPVRSSAKPVQKNGIGRARCLLCGMTKLSDFTCKHFPEAYEES
jgi:hypothetical protein